MIIQWLVTPLSGVNLGKCHFMVKEGIILGHRISQKGIEVDRAKVEVIERLSPLISVKGVRSFLGYADFYRRFIKDFSKIAHPLYKLLLKECKFHYDKSYLKVFGELKEKLVYAPIIISLDWSKPFEVCMILAGLLLVWYW